MGDGRTCEHLRHSFDESGPLRVRFCLDCGAVLRREDTDGDAPLPAGHEQPTQDR